MKQRVIRLFTVYFIIAAVLAVYAAIYFATGFGIPCIFNLITGLNCPGCGISRAARALSHFDFTGALECNYMLPFEALYLLYAAVYISAAYLSTGKAQLVVRPEWLNVLFLALLIIWGVVRNIAGV